MVRSRERSLRLVRYGALRGLRSSCDETRDVRPRLACRESCQGRCRILGGRGSMREHSLGCSSRRKAVKRSQTLHKYMYVVSVLRCDILVHRVSRKHSDRSEDVSDHDSASHRFDAANFALLTREPMYTYPMRMHKIHIFVTKVDTHADTSTSHSAPKRALSSDWPCSSPVVFGRIQQGVRCRKCFRCICSPRRYLGGRSADAHPKRIFSSIRWHHRLVQRLFCASLQPQWIVADYVSR